MGKTGAGDQRGEREQAGEAGSVGEGGAMTGDGGFPALALATAFSFRGLFRQSDGFGNCSLSRVQCR